MKLRAQGILTDDIMFGSSGAILSGTVYMPPNPHAAVVLVHGSGPELRMAELAALFAENGISVLTYDKRGVGRSGGIYVGPEAGTNNVDPENLTLLAEDASAAVSVLKHFAGDLPVGLAGFSQAGWIIPIAANKNPLVEFMVIFSGSVVPTLEQLRFQFFTDGDTDFWNSHTEAEVRDHILNAPDRYRFANTDPNDLLSTISIPGLWLFGGRDIQVPVGLSVERLEALMSDGKPYEYCIFPGLGHNLSYRQSAEPFEMALQWINSRE